MAKPRVPSYRLHKRSGQAIVTISGKMFYLGLYDSAESKAEYQRLISEWLASGQRAPQPASATTVNELLLAFIRHAKQHYRDADGKHTSSVASFKPVMRALKQQYGTASVERFTPKSLKALREQWIESGDSRRYINDNCARIKQIFKWGVSEEMVAESTFRALSTVTSLQANRSKARETEPRQPVPIADIDATLEHLPDVVGDMVRLQLLLACRPTELCLMRPADIDRTGDVWVYVPRKHKTQHKGKQRHIYIGPKAQTILAKYLLRDGESFCFSPAESEAQRRAKQHANRKTPLSCGNRPSGVTRQFKDYYTKDSYGTCVRRAAKRAGVPKWSPYQLRHTAATDIRRQFGLEEAQVMLGHSRAYVTEIYALKNEQLSTLVARTIG